MDSNKGRTPNTIIPTEDHEAAPGFNFVELVGGQSAGQLAHIHLEQGTHETPDGELYHRVGPHRFIADNLLKGMFGGGR